MYRLVSDGGSLTVGRRTANYTWGAFEVDLLDGQSQQEADNRIADGYIYRPDDRGNGRAELTFVRADAHLDLNASKSDLEATLDGASKRTGGDTFYTREIKGAGLGRTRPGEQYQIGDVVDVLLWGRVLPLPVTGIKALSSDSEVSGWAVQVGGQMVRDAQALRKRNDDIDAQIAREKRERLRQVGAVDSKATTAQSTATTAQSTAEAAKQSAVDALAQQQADFQAFQAERDAQQDAFMEALRAVQEASIRPVRGWLFLKTASASTVENEYLRINHSSSVSGTRSVEMLGSWTGRIICTSNGNATESVSGGDGSVDDSFTVMTEYAVPLPDGQRIITGSHTTSASFVRVDYEVSPGAQQSVTLVARDITLPQPSSWTQLTSLTWVAPNNTDFMGLVKVNFAAVPFLPWYGVRVTINGTTYKEQLVNHLGPLLGNGPRTLYIQINGITLNTGDEIKVLAYSDAGITGHRAISLATMDISWIE